MMTRLSQPSKRALGLLWKQETFRAALLYAVVVAALFAPVVFLGRSLQPPLYYPYGVTDQGAYAYDGREPINTFNIDLATPAYYEWPMNALVGEQYRQWELPLWNPYQGCGTPLAAQYSTRAFFPYQIVEDISPTWTWDFFMLGRLWLAGLFTFLFLRLLGLSRLSAFLGGIFYMFSGTFIWFINLEQFVNVAMVTPVLLWTAEGMWHWRWGRGVAGTAIAVALVLLAGQPEIAIYVLLLATAYVVYRVVGTAPEQRMRMAGSAVLAGLLGLALSAPLLLPFLEFVPHSHTIHPFGGTVGMGDAPAQYASSLLIPTLHTMPTWYRFFPDNGVWDFLGGYMGVLLPCLILVGLVLGFLQLQSRWRKPLLFFTILGVVILLKNFGSSLVSGIGYLPLLDQSWSPRWAGPAWTFSLAVAGALGLEIIRDQAQGAALRQKVAKWWQGLGNFQLFILGCFVLILGALGARLLMGYHSTLNPEQDEFFISSAVVGMVVALVVIVTAMILTRRCLRTSTGIGAFIALALLELWFVIPHGYEPTTAMLRLIPFAVGLLVVLALVLGRRRWVAVGVVVCVLATIIIDVRAEHGFPQRYDSVTTPPYVQYLESQDGYYRVTGGDGVLIPNFASTMGIQDIRYINALTPVSYSDFRSQNLHIEPPEPSQSSSLWFTGNPELAVIRGDKVAWIQREFKDDIRENLPFYSLLGVKYILAPHSYELQGELPTELEQNDLLINAGLDSWSLGPGPFTSSSTNVPSADGWWQNIQGRASFTSQQDSNDIDSDSLYCAAVDFTSAGGTGDYGQDMGELGRHLAGQIATFSIRVKSSTANAVRPFIWTDAGGYMLGHFHSGGGAYEALSATGAAPPNATAVWVGVRFLDSAHAYIENATLAVLRPFRLVYDEEIRIYENLDAFPRAWVAHEVEYASSYKEAQKAMRQPGFDLRQKVVLEELVFGDFSPLSGESSTAKIVDYKANQVVVSAEVEQPGILVLSDVFYPGWTATVDGAPAKIYRVDGLFRGVALDKGDHTIIFQYSPKSFKIGLFIAVLTLVGCLGLLISSQWPTGRKPGVTQGGTGATSDEEAGERR